MSEGSDRTGSFSTSDIIKIATYGIILVASFVTLKGIAASNTREIAFIKTSAIPELKSHGKECDKRINSLEDSFIERKGEFNMLRKDIELVQRNVDSISGSIESVNRQLSRLDPVDK